MKNAITQAIQGPILQLGLVLWITMTAAGIVIAGVIYLVAPEHFLALQPLPKSLLVSFFDQVVDTVAIDLAFETIIVHCLLLLLIRMLTQKVAHSNSWLPAFLITSIVFAATYVIGQDDTYLAILRVAPLLPSIFALSLLAIIGFKRNDASSVLNVCWLRIMYEATEFAIVRLLALVG